LYPHTNGVWGNEMALGRDTWTLGQRLRDANIHTAYIGKWHLSATDYFDTGECPDGWDADYWFDGRNHLETLSDEMRLWSRNYHTPEEIREADYTREKTFAGGVTDRALDFLNNHNDEDFCLVVSYDEPHHPSIAPEPFCDMYHDYRFEIGPGAQDDLLDKPGHHRHWAETFGDGPKKSYQDEKYYVLQPYFACNSFVDDEIGKVLDAIEANAPGALVIYTSDHGEMMWAHRLSSKGPVMYEQITRIPFIMKGPHIPVDTVIQGPVGHADITPTILDYFGVDCPPILQGKSLLEDASKGQSPDRPVIIEFNRHNVSNHSYGGFKPIRCIVNDRYKLVLNLLYTDELYDLQADPDEINNQIENPELVEVRNDLHKKLLEWMDETRDPFRGPEWEYRCWNHPENLKWPKGKHPRPEDQYHQPVLDYLTGLEV
ncbi:sulfatase-like hydrolase/transferase, partial [candidate division KSB3 bacterium]|nr:sulfatase-like hydrolase/transferase [candidate division KSB3 bacterium]